MADEEDANCKMLLVLYNMGISDMDFGNTSCFNTTDAPYNSSATDDAKDVDRLQYASQMIYGYVTPFIVVVGVIGNLISLKVFLSKTLRKQSASLYLITLSATDLTILLVYVLLEWTYRGLPVITPYNVTLNPLKVTGVCQTFLYLSYSCRFLSAWTIVVFTAERFLGVCKPILRRELCTKAYARKLVGGLVFVSLLLCLYKPILSTVTQREDGERMCATRGEYLALSQALDTIFALSTTIVPFLLVAILNILIVRKLLIRKKNQRQNHVIPQENIIRIEMTFILLAVSTGFIAVTLPYFVIWCIMASDTGHAQIEYLRGMRYITKTIFYLNYCMNFFLYSLTGAYFRRELKHMFSHTFRKDWTGQCSVKGIKSSRSNSLCTNSWV